MTLGSRLSGLDFKVGSLTKHMTIRIPLLVVKWGGDNAWRVDTGEKYLRHLSVLGAIVVMWITEWPGIC